MPLNRPIRYERGEALKASKLNAEAAQAITSVTGGPGLSVRRSGQSVSIALDGGRDVWLPARITAAPPPDAPIAHDSALYSARVIGEGSVAMVDAQPYFRNTGLRAGQTPAPPIYPARVGDECHIVLGPDPDNPGQNRARLAVWSEAIVWCPQNQGGT